MNNLEEVILKIIEEEKAINPDIHYLTTSHAPLIAQIVSNYKLSRKSNEELKDKLSATMLFIGAPTGAGKDSLVKKVMSDNKDKNFVVLNMDMFRYYHNQIVGVSEKILDKDFAVKTNQSSYELYYIIQEIILREFPGTDVIVTGTIKDLEWVKEIVKRYKKDSKTNYSASLLTLAVPENESAVSIFERYLNLVDERGTSTASLRYTDLSYHSETIKNFISNVGYFENELNNNTFFDSIKVYRRSKDLYDVSEDTLIYDSKSYNQGKTAVSVINKIMRDEHSIDSNRAVRLLNIIERNMEYLKSQGLYENIKRDLEKILKQLNRKQDFDFSEK